MLMRCGDCGHKWEINVSEKIRMDIETYMGEQTRCGMCESDNVDLV